MPNQKEPLSLSGPPRLIAWELTQACNLRCIHCRASATEERPADELSEEEARGFVETLPGLGRPILILTGGEPLMRRDVFDLACQATGLGLRVVLATNGTLIDSGIASKIVSSGIKRVSVSLDGPDSASHDNFRGVTGAFDNAIKGIEELKKAGVEFQINTTITKRNNRMIGPMSSLALQLGAKALHIFLLVPTGRGKDLSEDAISAQEYEDALNEFYDLSRRTDLEMKATCAPHYYRIVRQRKKEEHGDVSGVNEHRQGFSAMTRGCLGGTGFCFVSYRGDVCPCGYLPLVAGNIRKSSLKDIWYNASLFNDLRELKKLKGKCGRCEYRLVCGGCRARAYNQSGDYLAEEPLCIYQPGERHS
ncbi:heme b synthase [bacterium]|nr:heme b synthase [bacterium]